MEENYNRQMVSSTVTGAMIELEDFTEISVNNNGNKIAEKDRNLSSAEISRLIKLEEITETQVDDSGFR